MKFFNKLGLVGLFALAFVACVDQDPEIQNFASKDVDFTYEVAGGDSAEYKYDYYVVSRIQFNNVSEKTGEVSWHFGAAQGEYTADLSDINHPIVKYNKAGQYNVTMTIVGVGSVTYPILIYDISPKLSIAKQTMDLVILDSCKVDFALRLPNPEKKLVKYRWTFPAGAMDKDGVPLPPSIEYQSDPVTGDVECPKNISFSNIGSQQVVVDAWYDLKGENRRLEPAYLNVQVASPIPAPTLYYAQVGGNIKAIKLLDDDFKKKYPNAKVCPYDMGVNAGENPFNILYGETKSASESGDSIVNGWIYILDAGKQYYYINDEGGVLGDGKITAMRTNGTDVNTVITNVGGPAFSDPFQGFIYKDDLYYNDRNQGFSKISQSERGLLQGFANVGGTIMRDSYVAKNDLIPYYNRGIVFGAISNGLYKDSKGVWWWGKNYSGNGIYRFKDTDIKTTAALATAAPKPYDIVLEGLKFTSYAIDEANNKLYVWSLEGSGYGSGFVQYPLPKENETVKIDDKTAIYVPMYAKGVNTTDEEKVFVKQMAIDSRNGRVYFGFRAEEGDVWSDGAERTTGLVYFDPKETPDAAGKDKGNVQMCKNYGQTPDGGILKDEILGVTINPNPTKLF